jgi:hypothetical protein
MVFISEDEYNQLDEAIQRTFKRVGNTISRYYKCTSGPKAGSIVSDPSKCSIRKNPKRVRHGKKIAKQKVSVRTMKTKVKKKSPISKRLVKLNKQIKMESAKTIKEQLINNMITKSIIDNAIVVEALNNLNDQNFNLFLESKEFKSLLESFNV